ncbi:MAG: hypothetical protein LBV32_00925 [Tannerellaceae bacterium]|jgi:hypothetical protein|nr:hypothetical protein [Tannerellaceae bacterium]
MAVKFRIPTLVFFVLFSFFLSANDGGDKEKSGKEYSFLIQDSPSSLFTMRQSNETFLSLYRLSVNAINQSFSLKTSLLAQTVLDLFFVPLTHEEGHRSILTNENIGAISKPYFNKNMAAYVTGVRNDELIALRTANRPVFTRMYTAGLESDYTLLLREKDLLVRDQNEYEVLYVDYLVRKLNLISYYAMGLFKYNINLDEEADELKRDIAGHDVYGAIRSLHNPSMEFRRYVDYDDLLPEERKFVKRVGWRSLLNFLDPSLILHKGFSVREKYRLDFNFGYMMCPFGDLIDEHLWLKANRLNYHLYFRQFQNKQTWFPAFGLEISDINLFENFHSAISLHGWNQPKDMSFTGKDAETGGAIDLLCKYRFPINNNSRLKGVSLNLGLIAKTKGFLPEENVMGKHFGIRFGASIWLR